MSEHHEALRLAEHWEKQAKNLQPWVDENDYVEFGYSPDGLRRELEHQQQTAAELRRLHKENEALALANEKFGKRQEWWNERMFVLEAQLSAAITKTKSAT